MRLFRSFLVGKRRGLKRLLCGEMRPEVSAHHIADLLRTSALTGAPIINEVFGVITRNCMRRPQSLRDPRVRAACGSPIWKPRYVLEVIRGHVAFCFSSDLPPPSLSRPLRLPFKRGAWIFISRQIRWKSSKRGTRFRATNRKKTTLKCYAEEGDGSIPGF